MYKKHFSSYNAIRNEIYQWITNNKFGQENGWGWDRHKKKNTRFMCQKLDFHLYFRAFLSKKVKILFSACQFFLSLQIKNDNLVLLQKYFSEKWQLRKQLGCQIQIQKYQICTFLHVFFFQSGNCFIFVFFSVQVVLIVLNGKSKIPLKYCQISLFRNF